MHFHREHVAYAAWQHHCDTQAQAAEGVLSNGLDFQKCYIISQLMLRTIRLPRSPADMLGIGLSGLCALHCALGLVATLALSASSLSQGHHILHIAVLIFAIGLSVAAFAPRIGHAVSLPLALLAAGGCLLLLLALLVGHADRLEMLLSILGSFALSCAHLLNLKRARA